MTGEVGLVLAEFGLALFSGGLEHPDGFGAVGAIVKMKFGKDMTAPEEIGMSAIAKLLAPSTIRDLYSLYKAGKLADKGGKFSVAGNELVDLGQDILKKPTVGIGVGVGIVLDVIPTVYEYATDPKKNFESLDFGADISKTVAKSAIDQGLTMESTALGAAIGTAIFPGVGTVVGGIIGLGVGVVASHYADKAVDHFVGGVGDMFGGALYKLGWY